MITVPSTASGVKFHQYYTSNVPYHSNSSSEDERDGTGDIHYLVLGSSRTRNLRYIVRKHDPILALDHWGRCHLIFKGVNTAKSKFTSCNAKCAAEKWAKWLDRRPLSAFQ